MKQIFLFLLVSFLSLSCLDKPEKDKSLKGIPAFMLGEFEDDYEIRYKINQEVFHLLPNDKFHILEINRSENFIILQNDSLNKFAPSLFTKIDYLKLEDMKPYEWAFCFSSYNEASRNDALNKESADKSDFKKGCNGFPFSRMKRVNINAN